MIKRLKELRLNKNLTQTKLAEKFGITYSNIGEWERGKSEPSTNMLIKLANFFNVSIDYLVGRENFSNVTVSASVQGLTSQEERLLMAFKKLDDSERDKIIYDAEYFASKYHAKNITLKSL